MCLKTLSSSAQKNTDTLSQLDEVDIVKAYEPILISTSKILFSPSLPNIVKVKPDPQQYSFSDVKGKVLHPQEEIRPVKVSLAKPERNAFLYAKVGLGYPMTPLLQLVLANPVQTKYRAGITADFMLTKDFKDKYKQYTDLKLKGYGELYIKKSLAIGGDVSYRLNQHFYYGYTDVFTATKDSMKVNYNKVGASLNFRNLKNTAYYYNGDLNFNTTASKNIFNKSNEVSFKANFEGGYSFKSHYTVGSKLMFANVSLKNSNDVFLTKQNHFTIQAIPYASLKFKIWQLFAGPNIIVTNKHFYIWPEIVNQLQVYKSYLVLYNEWKTQVKINSLNNLSQENPFLLTSNYRNSVDETRTLLGLRGAVKGFGYDLRFSQLVSSSRAQFFSRLDSVAQFDNVTFDVQSVDTKAWNPHVGLSYSMENQLGAKVWFDYFIYSKNSDLQLSYLPRWKLGVSGFYNWKDRLFVNLDLYCQDKTNALQYYRTVSLESPTLIPVKGLIDVNLSATYFVNKHIGVFVDLNNLGFQKWQPYYRYNTYGAQFIAGVKLNF
jgi:hypothetical protein